MLSKSIFAVLIILITPFIVMGQVNTFCPVNQNCSITGNWSFNGITTLNSPIITGFQDKNGQVFNVLAYGAKGDGITNDTITIQLAINAACNGTINGIAFFPAGKSYLVNTITMPSNCKFEGGGTIVYGTGFNSSIVMGSNDRITSLNFNGVNNIGAAILGSSGGVYDEIDHNTFTSFINGSICFSTACGGFASPQSFITIDHNRFTNNEDGASVPPIFNVQCGDGGNNFNVLYNTFVGDGDFDIGIDGCNNSEIIGNYIVKGANGFGGAIQPEATSGNVTGLIINKNIIINPHFADGYSPCGIEMHTNGNGGSGSGAFILSNFSVTDNYVTGAPNGGICLFYTTNDTSTPGIVANNFVYKNAGGGMSLSGGELQVVGNQVIDNTGGGIGIACIVQPCSVVGNFATDDQVTKTQTYGLEISGTPWLAISGNGTNMFDGNLTAPVFKGAAFNAFTTY